MFEKIYKETKNAYETNIKAFNEQKAQEEEYKKDTTKEGQIRDEACKAIWNVINGIPDVRIVYSESLLNIVKTYKFKVLEYGKRNHIDPDEYCPTLEYYSVKYNHYKFIIKHLNDVDIPDGIFAVYEVEDLLNNNIIELYVDLGCRNTAKPKFDRFLCLLESLNEEDYLNKVYGVYKQIPELLEKKGYEILESNLDFNTSKTYGYIQVLPKVYVVIYDNWMNDIGVVVSNKKNWNVNSSNSFDTFGYYTTYKSSSDIDNLAKTIDAFNKHIKGEYGFYENGKYYKNSDIENYLKKFSLYDKNGDIREAINNHHVQIEKVNMWDGRGFNGRTYINVYEGLEMAMHFNFTLNDAAQWSIGDIINDSDIIIKYDREIDPDNCILLINNYQYKASDEYLDYEYDENGHVIYNEYIDKLKECYNKDYLIDSIEFRGTYTQCIKMLDQYTDKMMELFNIKL